MEPYSEQNVFAVTSNSTITELAFNSTSKELSFGVSGDLGTTGYVSVNIPKSLVNDVSAIKVYVDNKQIDYSYTSQDEQWLLYFFYHHSTHIVDIKLDSSNPQGTPLEFGWVQIAILGIMTAAAATTIIVVALTFREKKPSK
jgi:hypothetical protein